ncbi:TBC1 domain family member 10A-like protein [Labeo rohita]|uniref:TBC1 domain family member 10A-like protein n=2 Tax=Labeonini TaxID=2743697 RepID=A0A498LCG3_LABRO|nr:TBC1 domain family member 10A-like protein [Labeo rohita]
MMAQQENGRLSSEDTMSVRTLGSQFDEESSFGSDSEINGFPSLRRTDKYGFIGGAQQYSAESAQDVPLEVLRHREVKWLDMLNHWDKWISKRFKKVRLRCQKGIPPSLRGRAWLYLSGGKVKREQNPGKFEELDSMDGDPKWVDVIERDLHRQFPFHEMFVSRGGHGQQDLFRVLKAYTLYRPDEGYCQAQAPIAAVLLMHMPAEDAFWGLVQICEKYLPGYYSAGLEAIQLDGEILNALLKRVCPPAYRHLEKHKIEPILYMTEWFMCAFSRTLPWASVLRVWDMFLCDGVKIIFRVGLVLLKCMLGSREKLKACPGQYETMELLRALEQRYMQEAFLVQQILELPISARDVEREHRMQLKRWRKTHGELSYKSPPRMHGAQAIMSAEPHTRQDLRQKPTIIVQYPLPSDTKSEFARVKKRSTIRKAPNLTFDVPNPYALPTDPKPAPLTNQTHETASNNQSKHPPPSLQHSHLTTPKQTPSSAPPASVVPPQPSPNLSRTPPPPQPSPKPKPARDVEREHRMQLKRWRKTHGELSYKSPPRMHGAQAIMSAEPHTRQDLRQKPTIIVQYPLPSDTKSEFARVKKRSTIRKAPNLTFDVPNPYALPTDPKPAPLTNQTHETASNNQSKHPPPSLQQSHLTTPKQTPSSDPPASVVPPQPSPNLSRTPPPPQPSPKPKPAHVTEIPRSSNPAVTVQPLPLPKDSSNTNNSAHLIDPPPTTDSTPLLPDVAPVNGNSAAAPTVPGLRNSFESVGSEDTYL